MAIASPSSSSISSSFWYNWSESSQFVRFPSTFGIRSPPNRYPLRLTISSSLESSNSTGGNGSGELQYELKHELPMPRRRRGSPVFVMLPIDVVSSLGEMTRRKVMTYSLRALAVAGVEGVVMEVWWGLVERDAPMNYDWRGYLEIVTLAQRFGLKVRAVMAFHQCGDVGDSFWIPLPHWVRQEMAKDPDLAYSDRFGRRNQEYISLGCDIFPVLKGRSPVQTYSDFMRNFRDTFKEFLGVVITGIQLGMGPAGELRYPSCPSQKLTSSWRFRELGEFQCYDKYMLASLNACAHNIGMREWGNGGPLGAGNLMHNPEETHFFKSDGSWNTPYGKFFLEWYSGMLLLHGERLCMAAETIFWGTGVNIAAKVAGIHWHYGTDSHPSELTAGYYNTSTRDGYLPITRLFGRYGVTLCCTCFEMKDTEEKEMNPFSSPEGLLRQIVLAARSSDLPLEGENSVGTLNDESLKQVLKMSKFYSDGLDERFFSFNFMRMGQSLFESQNWARFTGFVRQMSGGHNLQAKLDFGWESCISSLSTAEKVGGVAFTYYR